MSQHPRSSFISERTAQPSRRSKRDFSFVCFCCLSRALGRTGPPLHVLYISSRLPRNKMELADNINTTTRLIKEGAQTYRDGSLE